MKIHTGEMYEHIAQRRQRVWFRNDWKLRLWEFYRRNDAACVCAAVILFEAAIIFTTYLLAWKGHLG